MFWKCNRNKQVEPDTTYLAVPEHDMTEELKQTIARLEQFAEKNGALLCNKSLPLFIPIIPADCG
jgi:hypothetical protein